MDVKEHPDVSAAVGHIRAASIRVSATEFGWFPSEPWPLRCCSMSITDRLFEPKFAV